MGGFIADTLKAIGDLYQDVGEKSIGQWLKPASHVIEGTAPGRAMVDMLKNNFEFDTAQATYRNRTVHGMNSQDAWSVAAQVTGDKYFGKNGEGLVNFLKAVSHNSGGNKIHLNNVADAMDMVLGEKGISYPNWRFQATRQGIPLSSLSSKYVPPGPVESKFKEIASWIFLPKIVIPHSTQPLNVLLYNGAKAFAKATADMTRDGLDVSKRRIIQSGSLEQDIMYQMIDTAKGGGIARKLFHMPGFNFAREMQITHAALAGEYAVKEAFSDYLANGRKVTPEIELAFERMGIDSTQLGGLNQLTPEMIQRAQYRAAQSTYFIRSTLDVPYPWGQNWMARTATLYKNFGYNQGRFMLKALRDAWNTSPEEFMKTTAIITTLFPIAGYAVKSVDNAINLRPAPTTDKEREQLADQYIDAIGHAAGFGLAYSMFRSAKRNALAEYFIGPIPATITDYAQDIINAPQSSSRRRTLGRDFLRRVPLVGPGLSEELLPRQRSTQ